MAMFCVVKEFVLGKVHNNYIIIIYNIVFLELIVYELYILYAENVDIILSAGWIMSNTKVIHIYTFAHILKFI